MTSKNEISSAENLHQRVRTIAGNLDALEALLADFSAARQRFAVTEREGAASLDAVHVLLTDLTSRQTAVAELIEAHERGLAALDQRNHLLDAALSSVAEAKAALERRAAELEKFIGRALTDQMQQLDEALQQIHRDQARAEALAIETRDRLDQRLAVLTEAVTASLDDQQKHLDAELERLGQERERLGAITAQQQRDLNVRLDAGLRHLDSELEAATRQQRAGQEEWQNTFAERQARQLDDLLRAYTILSTRQNEVEGSHTARLDKVDINISGIDRRFDAQDETLDSLRGQLVMTSRRLDDEEQFARASLSRLTRKVGLASNIGVTIASVILFLVLVALIRN